MVSAKVETLGDPNTNKVQHALELCSKVANGFMEGRQ